MIVDLYAGDKGWTLDRGGVSDVPATDIADYQEQLKMQMGNVLRNRLNDRGLFFRYGGSDVVDLKEADWVEIGDQGRTLRIAVGRNDHLPIRSVLPNAIRRPARIRSAAPSTRPIIRSTASRRRFVNPGF